MFTKKHCSPRKCKIDYSCLSKNILISIAKILNKNYNAKIKIKKRSKKKLYNDIKEKLSRAECKTESCGTNINKIMDKLSDKEKKQFNESFRPLKPDNWNNNANTWLNTTDINNVMRQYEKKYPYFKYYGATPIDFHIKSDDTCLVSNLCNINLNNLKNKKCIGMVFNTDPHNKSGQHWFSMFIDTVGRNLENPTIYYFDSATAIKDIEELPLQILNLIDKLQKQSNNKFDILYNDIKHQYGSTECGVYCIHFLTEMLKGIAFEDYVSKKLSDKKIEKYRNKFFIENK